MKEAERRRRRDLFQRKSTAGKFPKAAVSVRPVAEHEGDVEFVPRWILEDVEETEKKASPGSIPVLVLQNADGNDLAVMKLTTLQNHFASRAIGEFVKEDEKDL